MAPSFDQPLEFLDPRRSANENLNTARIARNVWLVLLGQSDLKRMRANRAGKFVACIRGHLFDSVQMGVSKSGRIPGEYRIDLSFEDSGFAGLAVQNAREGLPAKF